MIFSRKNKYKNLNDEELLLKYKDSGNNIFMELLYERYYHLIYGVSLKYLKDRDESKDTVIQVFEKVMIEAKKIEISNFNSWIYSVSKNHCLMKLRAEKRMKEREKIYVDENFESIVEFSGVEDNQENLKKLELAISELNTEQKTCVKMFYLEEMTYNKISEKTGFSINQVKSYIQNGKRNIINKFKA